MMLRTCRFVGHPPGQEDHCRQMGLVNGYTEESACVEQQEKWIRKYFDDVGVPHVTCSERLWYSTGSKIYVHIPCCGPISVKPEESKTLWRSGAVFLKYPLPPELPGYSSYIYLVSDKNYGLDSLTHHVKKETVRSLRKCHVEKIPVKEILSVAPDIIADTHMRQEREFNRSIMKEWMLSIEAAIDNPIFECWAAFVGEKVGAFRIDFTYRGGFYGDVLFNVKSLLKYQVMNALMFVSTEQVMKRPHIDHVSYGVRSIYGDRPSLNRFKESMGYERIPLSERVEISPRYSRIVSHDRARLGACLLGKLGLKSQKFQKLEAILNMYAHQLRPDV